MFILVGPTSAVSWLPVWKWAGGNHKTWYSSQQKVTYRAYNIVAAHAVTTTCLINHTVPCTKYSIKGWILTAICNNHTLHIPEELCHRIRLFLLPVSILPHQTHSCLYSSWGLTQINKSVKNLTCNGFQPPGVHMLVSLCQF